MKIVICGGGTTGWLSALYLCSFAPENDYTLIESSSIGTIGVGEGSTGLFRELISGLYKYGDIGIDEHDFIINTETVPKLGINFKNWGSKSYVSPIDGSVTASEFPDWASLIAISRGDDSTFPTRQGIRGSLGKIPYININHLSSSGTPNQGGAYHFNGIKVAEYFKKFILEDKKFPLKVFDSEIVSLSKKNNIISEIELKDKNILTDIDLVIDCLGLNSIFSKEMNRGWVDYSKYLPVNSALVFKRSNDDLENTLAYTDAIAMKNGWMFQIPVGSRYGCGYIYSDSFCSDADAEEELKDMGYDTSQSRKIKFSSGRLKEMWKGNVVAMGLSSGFLEPLQATSLHTTICHLELLCRNYLTTQNIKKLSHQAKHYNKKASTFFDDFSDFISLHYQCDRKDTEFWKYVTRHPTKNTKVILDLCKTRLPNRDDYPLYSGSSADLWNSTIHGLGLVSKSSANIQLKYFFDKFGGEDSTNAEYDNHVRYFNDRDHCLTMKEFLTTYYN